MPRKKMPEGQNKQTLTIRLKPDLKKRFKDVAEERGLNETEAVEEALEIWTNFDNTFWKALRQFGKTMGLPLYLILQNLVIAWQAREEAREEVFGPTLAPLDEFTFDGDGPITGNRLKEDLKKGYIKAYEPQLLRDGR